MDVAHAVGDQVFLKLQQPQLVHLVDDVEKLGHHSRIVDDDLPLNEKSPLIVKAGKQRVYVDSDLDLEALDRKLHDEESAAIDEDQRLTSRAVFQEESKSLIVLSVPITLALYLELIPLILIAMMIGNVSGDRSPQVLAAGSLSDFVMSQVLDNVTNGLGAAVAAVCAQSFGAKKYEQLWIYAQAGVVAGIYCLVPLTVVCLNSASILRLMGQDADLAHVASELITVVFIALPFSMFTTVSRSVLQAQNIAMPFVIAAVASYCISLPLGYFLGNYTSLGFLGVASSRIVSAVIKACAVLPIFLNNKLFRDTWRGWRRREANRLAIKLWPMTVGSVLMATFQTCGFNTLAIICGFLPNAPIVMTANSISSALAALAFIPMLGLCGGGIVRIGNALGAGQARRASLASVVIIIAMVVVSVLGVLMCWLSASSYATAYTSNVETIQLSNEVVIHLLRFIPAVGLVFAGQSIFQACGEAWLCAKLNFTFLFALGLPVELWLAFGLGQGVFGLWDGLLIASMVFVVASSVWYYRLDWHKTAHQAHENTHLHVERALSDTEMSFD